MSSRPARLLTKVPATAGPVVGLLSGTAFALGESAVWAAPAARSFAASAGAVLMIGGALAVARTGRRRIAGCVSFCALALAAFGPVSTPAPRVGIEPGLVAGMLTLLLAVAVAALHVRAPVSWRFGAAASATLVCLSLSVVLLLSGTVVQAELFVELAACIALSVICLHYLLGQEAADAVLALRWLRVPVAVAGIVTTAVISAVLLDYEAVPLPQRIGWAVFSAVLLLSLTISVIANVHGRANVLELDALSSTRKRALTEHEAILRERDAARIRAQTRFDELFSTVPIPIVLTCPAGMVRAANPAAVTLLGVDSEDRLKTMNFSDFYANPESRRHLIDEWSASDNDVHRGEVSMRRFDGSEISVLYAIRVIRDENGCVDYLQGTLTDITALRKTEAERRALETHLRLSQKLESVGRLAAGIAHEINTPMQYISDNVYFLKYAFETVTERSGADSSPAADQERRDALDAVPRALERTQEGIETVTRIVAAMKELAHPGHGNKVSTNVGDLVETALVVTRNEYKTVANVETNLADGPAVPLYRNEMCQVLINLIVNASQAIEAVSPHDPDRGTIAVRTYFEHDSVCIEVEDDGIGIPAVALDKIFDPFFTTKEVGTGTGQGLAIVRSIVVDKHGGRVDVESVAGEGTKFILTLPVGRQPFEVVSKKLKEA